MSKVCGNKCIMITLAPCTTVAIRDGTKFSKLKQIQSVLDAETEKNNFIFLLRYELAGDIGDRLRPKAPGPCNRVQRIPESKLVRLDTKNIS